MTRSYVTDEGERIYLSDEHLETAVKIKIELQKANFGRTNWNTHQKMMRAEGYSDSGTNASYLSAVKGYQARIGLLGKTPALPGIDGMSSFEPILGELSTRKRDIQKHTTELNRLRRELQDRHLLMKEIREAISGQQFTLPTLSPVSTINNPTQKKKSSMISVLSDWHIGAIVKDAKSNESFNYQKAIEMIDKLSSRIAEKAIKEEVSDLYIVSVGDLVEHLTMRYAQAFECEFTFSEQIVKTSQLVLRYVQRLITALTPHHVHIHFTGIAGNHDRMEANKKNGVYTDTVAHIVNYFVQSFIDTTVENEQSELLSYIEPDTIYRTSLNVNGVYVKFVHGDLDNLKDEKIIGTFSQLDEKNYSLVVGGHVHHNRLTEVGDNKYIAVFGSLKGSDSFSDAIRTKASRSQGYIIIGEGEIQEINTIRL